MSVWEFRLRVEGGDEVDQTIVAEGADESAAADSAATLLGDQPYVALVRPGRTASAEVEARWREVFDDAFPGLVSDAGRFAQYARGATASSDRAVELASAIERDLEKADMSAREATANGEAARAERLRFAIQTVRDAIAEAGAPEEADHYVKLMLALQLGLSREQTFDVGGEDIDTSSAWTIEHVLWLVRDAVKLGVDANKGPTRIGRHWLDRLIDANLAAERDWAGRAMLRRESRHARLCLVGLERTETAIRRAQDGVGDYGIRLIVELRDGLEDWESQIDDEDGFGSACIWRIIRLVEDVAAAGVDEGYDNVPTDE